MLENYGIQELTELSIKAISPILLGGKQFAKGENILFLKHVEISNLQEETTSSSATGGSNSLSLVRWVTHGDINFTVQHGVLSQRELSLLVDSDILQLNSVEVSRREEKTVNSEKKITLDEIPTPDGCYCYDEQGNKLTGVGLNGKVLTFADSYRGKLITIDYHYIATGSIIQWIIGENFLSNVIVRVEAKVKLKDDVNGEERTGILIIPKANIEGSFNLYLGEKASPIVGNFVCRSVKNDTRKKGENANYSFTILND